MRYFRDLRLPVGTRAFLASGPCTLTTDGFREPCTKFLYRIFLGQSQTLRNHRFKGSASRASGVLQGQGERTGVPELLPLF